MSAITDLDGNDPTHRAALITALADVGLTAYEDMTAPGMHHVCVDIYTTEGLTIQIATGTANNPCDVFLFAIYQEGEVVESSPMPCGSFTATTVAGAVAAFQYFAAERNHWIERLDVTRWTAAVERALSPSPLADYDYTEEGLRSLFWSGYSTEEAVELVTARQP